MTTRTRRDEGSPLSVVAASEWRDGYCIVIDCCSLFLGASWDDVLCCLCNPPSFPSLFPLFPQVVRCTHRKQGALRPRSKYSTTSFPHLCAYVSILCKSMTFPVRLKVFSRTPRRYYGRLDKVSLGGHNKCNQNQKTF